MASASPRQRRHEKNRQAILDIAAGLIVAHGYEKLSLREVARRADYSPAALYEFFRSKEGILAALKGQIGRKLILVLNAVPENPSPRDRLARLALAYIRFAIANGEQFRLMSSLPTRRRSFEEPVPPDSPYNVFLETIRAAIISGAIKPKKDRGAEEITYGLWALIHGMALLRLTQLQGFRADFEKIDSQAIETFLDGLR
jgi:AcrR family transcriptional regulator